MKRLTDKNHNAINKCGDYSSCYSCRKEICYISELEQKLGELEDILESWHIENLEELKTRLHDCQVYHLKNNSNETLIHNLKNELADLQHRLEVAEKALELACEELMSDLEFDGELDKHYNLQANIEYFKTKAKEMLENE